MYKMQYSIINVIFAVIVINIVQIQGWIELVDFDENSNHTSHCYVDEFNIGEMQENEEKRVEGQCANAVCRTDRTIKITGCAPLIAEPPCYVTKGNLSKPFPSCCYEIVCEKVGENKL